MCFQDTMHDGYSYTWYFVDGYVSCMIPFVGRVGQEEEVSAIECWLHGPTVCSERG